MIDGTYEFEAKTPLGKKEGTLVAVGNGDVCEADLTMLGETKHLKGSLDGNTATFTGSVNLPFPIGKVDYTLVGTVEGDELKAKLTSKKFNFDIFGHRVA